MRYLAFNLRQLIYSQCEDSDHRRQCAKALGLQWNLPAKNSGGMSQASRELLWQH